LLVFVLFPDIHAHFLAVSPVPSGWVFQRRSNPQMDPRCSGFASEKNDKMFSLPAFGDAGKRRMACAVSLAILGGSPI
jgi:hypothetical protein